MRFDLAGQFRKVARRICLGRSRGSGETKKRHEKTKMQILFCVTQGLAGCSEDSATGTRFLPSPSCVGIQAASRLREHEARTPRELAGGTPALHRGSRRE